MCDLLHVINSQSLAGLLRHVADTVGTCKLPANIHAVVLVDVVSNFSGKELQENALILSIRHERLQFEKNVKGNTGDKGIIVVVSIVPVQWWWSCSIHLKL